MMKQAISLFMGLCILTVPMGAFAFQWWGWWSSTPPDVPSSPPVVDPQPAEPPISEIIDEWKQAVRDLRSSGEAVEASVHATGASLAPAAILWRRLLQDKIEPQLDREEDETYLAAVGPTNVGKTVQANHLANGYVSAVSHKARTTTNSVMIINTAHAADLSKIQAQFPDLVFKPRRDAADAATDHGDQHVVYYDHSDQVPSDLVVFDTADIDSSNRSNWEKAYRIARAADVLIAVITGQKYDDDKVIEFFKQAQAMGKPVIIIINQVTEAQKKRGFWRDWLTIFQQRTGIKRPFKVYVVPEDYDKAMEGKQDFLAVSEDGLSVAETSTNLRESLRGVDKKPLRRQAQHGALWNALKGGEGGTGGVHENLRLVTDRANRYRTAIESLRNRNKIDVTWPKIPKEILCASFSEWFDSKYRATYVKGVLGFFSTVEFIPRKLWSLFASAGSDHEAILQRAEERAIENILNAIFDDLSPLVSQKSDLLSESARELLNPGRTSRLVSEIRDEYLRREIKDEHGQIHTPHSILKRILTENFPLWEKEHEHLLSGLWWSDLIANGGIRPAVVSSPIVGTLTGPGGALLGAIHLMAAPTGAILGVTGLSTVVSTVYDYSAESATKLILRKMEEGYARMNVDWVIAALHRRLAPIHQELTIGSTLDTTDAYKKLSACSQYLTEWGEKNHPDLNAI